MRILHITYSPGGVTTYLNNLNELSPDKVQHFYISPDAIGESVVYKVKYRRFSLLDPLEFLIVLIKVLRLKPDTIHLHSSKAGFYFRFLSLFFKVFYSSHAFAFLNKNSRMRLVYYCIEKLLCWMFPRVKYVANSSGDARRAQSLGFKKVNILLNPFSIKSAICSYEDRFGSKEKQILIVGRLTFQKNQVEVLKFIREVNGLLNDFKFIFIGLGDIGEKSREKEFIEMSKGIPNVECIGWVSKKELSMYYQEAFALLSFTKYESFGYVNVEAMSFGLPVVSSKVDGPPDYIKNGENGYIIDSLSELINILTELKTNYIKYELISTSALNTVITKFEKSITRERILKSYTSDSIH